MNNIVILDVQTRRSFEDVGGKKAIHNMGISIASVYMHRSDQLKQFEEEDYDQIISELKNSSLIFGVQLRKFIFKLLNHYADFDISSVPCIDLIDYFKQKLYVHDPLEGLYLGTLGFKKVFYHETHSPKLFKSGKLDEIRFISKTNVEDLNNLLTFGLSNNYVYFLDMKGLRWRVPVDWHRYP
ncbi:hypothetical protein JXB12_12275 [candidate division KSB1 bacterium]|nr:hypothetical protein [candidate division KSB1 bacterium]